MQAVKRGQLQNTLIAQKNGEPDLQKDKEESGCVSHAGTSEAEVPTAHNPTFPRQAVLGSERRSGTTIVARGRRGRRIAA